jgi:perosamine synthetase
MFHQTLSTCLPEKYFDSDIESYITDLRRAFKDERLSGTALPVSHYEAALSSWFGTDYALAVASGSAAVFIALHALGVQAGDKIIVSSLAPIPSILPILHIGAEPLFVDIKPGSFQFDIADITKTLDQHPKAILAVALWGYPVLTSELLALLAENDIPLIEDSAHAHGTIELGKLSGTLGHIGCFSTHDNKMLATGEGGFVLTNSKSMYEKMKAYSHLGYCQGRHAGFNFKLSASQALLGQNRLRRLQAQIEQRQSIANDILEKLNLSSAAQIIVEDSSRQNFYNLGLFINANRNKAQKLIGHCHANGLITNAIKYNIMPSYRYPLLSRFVRECPNVERMAYNITSIPCTPNLSKTEVSKMVAIFNQSAQLHL